MSDIKHAESISLISEEPKHGKGAKMEKLKPCPFCGSEFMSGVYISARWRKGTANRKQYWITCGKCRVEQRHGNGDGYRTIANAVKAWNRRWAESDAEG